MSPLNSWPLLAAALVLMQVFALAACESDAQRVREMNAAERMQTQVASGTLSPSPTLTPISAEIETAEVQGGDCINSTIAEGTEIETVVIVPCSGSWQYRVLNLSILSSFRDYPGEDWFSELAYEICDRRSTTFLYPTRDSWALNDKKISCLQHSFGLSAVDRPKLDRLVAAHRLRVGECFNGAPETGDLLVEVVDCSSDWESQVVIIFSVPRDDTFPGDAYFQEQADQNCHTPWDYYYYPDDQSWRWGDRDVICVRAS